MNILIVSQYYYPEQFQINEIAPELVRRGHGVTVLTGLPNYPKGEIYEGYENGEHRDEYIDGVYIIRVDEKPRKHGAIHLLKNYYSFYINGNKAAKRLHEKFDVVMSYQLSPITMACPAITYAEKNNFPLLLYCLDIWPESAQAHVKSDKGLIYKYISKLSKKIYGKCDRIAVTSRPFIDYLNEKNDIPTEKMCYIPQHADASYLDLDLSSNENGVADFMYAGNFGAGQVLENIVLAAEQLKERNDFRIHMVGDGSKRAELEKLATERGVLDKVIFYGNQKREIMPDFYRKADALLLTLRGNNAVGNTMPGKMQTYMTTGKPIFGAINGAASEVIAEAECGKCVQAGDYIGLSALMADYIDNPQKYSKCGANAKRYFLDNFTLDKFTDSLEKELTVLLRQK